MKRVFITGVNRGLGRGLATSYLDAGHTVFGSTRSGDVDLPIAECVRIDVRDPDSIREGVAAVAAATDALDVLINSAGINAQAAGAAETEIGPLDVDPEAFSTVFDVNVTGPMMITRASLPLLRRGTDPVVVNISSQLGSMERAKHMGKGVAYSVSKAALNMLSVVTARELQPDGVGVVMIHPGWVRTDMGGSYATLTVEESAATIMATIGSLTLADTGRFMQWDARPHPW